MLKLSILAIFVSVFAASIASANDITIFQTADGLVVILGSDDATEAIYVDQLDETTLRFLVCKNRGLPCYFTDDKIELEFSNVTGIYVDFATASEVSDDNQFTLGTHTTVNGSIEIYSSDLVNAIKVDMGGFSEVAGDFVVRSHLGDDKFYFGLDPGYFSMYGDIVISGDLDISSDEGTDEVWLGQVEIAGDLTIDTGKHQDVIRLYYVDLLSSFSVSMGGGNDSFHMDDCWIRNSTSINLNGGRDELSFVNSSFGPTTIVNGGNKHDFAYESGDNLYGKTKWFLNFEDGNVSGGQ